jgi:drug/metabolite transporter (DMT)-like permease
MPWPGESAGELAALATATCWTASSLCFEVAGRRIGSLSLNLVRLGVAAVLLAAIALVLRGRALPIDVPTASWGWLTVSGLAGFVFGDLCLFRALVTLGARRTMLVQTAAPAMAVLLAWPVLGETPTWRELGGMALITAGVGWAISARTRASAAPETAAPVTTTAVLLALGGALGQGGGLVLSKLGLEGVHPVAATQVRLVAGVAGFVVVLTVARWWSRFAAALADRRGMAFASLGALFGPCIGVSLSLYAVAHAPAGVAASLMALTPVLLVPVAAARGEHVGVAGVAGAVVAVGGVIVLTTG